MGKSTAGNLLLEAGYPLVDTDDLARQLVLPGQPALDEIRAVFGEGVISEAGELIRSELARIVFNDVSARLQLEAILHPRIRDAWQQSVEAWRREGRQAGFVVIPLLFETKAEGFFDGVVCVACSKVTQRQRLLARGWDELQIEARLAAQWPIEQKMNAADFVIWTDAAIEVHAAQWHRLLRTEIGV